MASNWLSLAHFVRKVGGIDHVYEIVDKINAGCKQSVVAEAYGLDGGYLSKVMSMYFEWHLIPQADTLLFLSSRTKHLEEHNAEQGRIRARVYDLAAHRRKAEGETGE